MEYFRAWAPDDKNGLLFVGYQAEGTFGNRLQRGMAEATFLDGPRQASVPVKLEIATIEGFSGHSDRVQLMNYVASLDPRPQRIITGRSRACWTSPPVSTNVSTSSPGRRSISRRSGFCSRVFRVVGTRWFSGPNPL
jgi:predicted metal-dependent RNase